MSGTMKKASCSEYGCCPEPYYCTQPPPPCFPSICDVSKSMNCHLSTDSNGSDTACPPYGTHQPYGRNRPPPCGLGMTSNDCSSCCWDTTLCFPTVEKCSPGENFVHIPKCAAAETISQNVASALAVYNYSLQNVISRGLKFVTSYYDWLYCQIGLYKYRNDYQPGETSNDTISDDHLNIPPQYYSSNGTETNVNIPGWSQNLQSNIGLGDNYGNAYTPPANLFAQVAQILGWADNTFTQVDLANCVCNNLCQFIQMLINIEGSSVIRDFVKDQTFNSANDQFSPTYLGCGNLYDEGQLVDFGDSVLSIIDLIVAVLTNLGVDKHIDEGEQILEKLCLCLAKAAGRGTCGLGGCDMQGNFSLLNTNTTSSCPEACPDLATVASILSGNSDHSLTSAQWANPEVVGYQNQIYRQQFFTMFIDALQFILFDRDCNAKNFERESMECGPCNCVITPPTQEEWLKSRCRTGTGNGKCVVCSGCCAKFRRKDDYVPLFSSLYAVKYAVKLLTLDRSDVEGQHTYVEQVADVYNSIISEYTTLYKDHGDTLTFYPDCAAPQFCCSTKLAAEKSAWNCCTGTCQEIPGCCLYPVPVIDTRKASWCAGQGVTYTPSLGGCWNIICGNVEGSDTIDEEDVGKVRWDCYSNPCVIMPFCCNSITCDPNCCTQNSRCNDLV